MEAIRVENINYSIAGNVILHNVACVVPQGGIYGLVGQNGAGKTTLLNIILGLKKKQQGDIYLFGEKINDFQRKRIGAVLDNTRLEENLSARQYIKRLCIMNGDASSEIVDNYLRQVGIENVGNKPIKTFSYGMKKRLLIAQALVGNPDLLILDEPFNGIDANGMTEMRLLLQKIASEGVTIFFTSHNISELVKLATIYGIIVKGTLIQQYTAEEVGAMNIIKKKVITQVPERLIAEIKKRYPDVYCTSEEYGSVSVYGGDEVDFESLRDFYEKNFEIETFIANAEDILQWKMNTDSVMRDGN